MQSMWKVCGSLAALQLGLEALATRFHNHDPSELAALHVINRRPAEAEKQEIFGPDRGLTIPALPRPTDIMVLLLTDSA